MGFAGRMVGSTMRDEITRFEAEQERLSLHKLLCTGEPLSALPREVLSEAVHSLAAFKALVSQLYVLWKEEWGRDVGFLMGIARQATPRAQSFGQTLTRIRTAHQHSPAKQDVLALASWYSSACGTQSPSGPDEWTTCAKELIVELTDAVSELADAAMTVQQRDRDRRAWQERVAESVRSAVVRVATDLGLRLSESQIDYHKRQVDGRWRNWQVPSGRDARSELDSLVERSLMAQSPRLPCDHLEVLRELEVIGSPSAFAGIQLAHAVATVSRTRGAAFLKLVVATWSSVQPTGPKTSRQ
ncbi:hypothetical protein AB0J55_00670 [Amycolatopsis sp. NPDC049688]|uniref:hypothetical protein n=1 Tax=Amycolatopsis sp. NPDC049688 TaxID=3154733 RepID=UPI00341331C6